MKFLGLFVSYELGQICTKFRIHELFIKSVWIKLLGANFVNKPNASRWGNANDKHTGTESCWDLVGWAHWRRNQEKQQHLEGQCVSSQVEQGVGLLHTAEFRRRVDRGSVGKPPSGHQIQEEKGKVDIFCTTISVHTSTPEQEPAFPAVPLSLVPCSCRQHTLTQDFTNRGLPLLPTACV